MYACRTCIDPRGSGCNAFSKVAFSISWRFLLLFTSLLNLTVRQSPLQNGHPNSVSAIQPQIREKATAFRRLHARQGRRMGAYARNVGSRRGGGRSALLEPNSAFPARWSVQQPLSAAPADPVTCAQSSARFRVYVATFRRLFSEFGKIRILTRRSLAGRALLYRQYPRLRQTFLISLQLVSLPQSQLSLSLASQFARPDHQE